MASRLLPLIGASTSLLLGVAAAAPDSGVQSPDASAGINVSPTAEVNVSPPAGPIAPSAPAAPTVNAPAQSVTPNYPAGVGEIVRMLDANVEHDTIKAYIGNSFTYWPLTSQDIINLKERNVPSDIVAAMLRRDAELRDQAMQAAQVNPSSAPAPYDTNASTVATPSYDSSGQYASAYPYAADGYPYSYYPYSYPYPYNYGGWWGWPVWGGGVVFFDSFGHSHFHNDGHHHDGHGDFHHADPHGNSFHGNHGNMAGWHGNTGNGWHGNTGNSVVHGSGSMTHSAPFGVTHNSTFNTRSSNPSTFSTRSSSPQMGSFSRGFGTAGIGHSSSIGHFGGSMGGHMGMGGGGGTHMGGGGGGHGGGGGGHR